MPLIEQLEKLRRHLITVFVLFLVVAALGYGFSGHLFSLAADPFFQAVSSGGGESAANPPNLQDNLIYVTPLEAFGARLKLAFYAAFLVILPFLFQAGWGGAAAGGLFDRRYVWVLSGGCTLFFWAGVAFSYFLVLPLALKFFLGFASEALNATWSIGKYSGFFIQFTLIFGAVFELPMIILALGRMGLVNVVFLREKRGYAIVIIFLLAALFTPPDVVTQLLLGVPLILLYELSLLLVQWFGKKPQKAEEMTT